MRIRDYITGPSKDRDGSALPFTRLDIGLSVALGFVSLVTISYCTEPTNGWSLLRVVVIGGAVLVVTVLTERWIVVLGGALGIVTMRLFFGVLLGVHPALFLCAALACGAATLLLLKDV